MSKVYEINGDSTFDIRGRNNLSELRIADSTRGLNWLTEEGTTIENLIQIHHPKADAQLEAFRRTTLKGFDENVLVESVSPFLAPGMYRLELANHIDLDAYLDEASRKVKSPTRYYGGCYSMVATQPKEQLRETTVNWFRDKIRDGGRPLALGICVNASWEDGDDDLRTVFILDGHHRLEAYRQESIKPHVCVLARMNPPRESPEYMGIPHE